GEDRRGGRGGRGAPDAGGRLAGRAGAGLVVTVGSTADNPATAPVVAACGGHPLAYWWYVCGGRRPAAAGGARRNASYFWPGHLVAARLFVLHRVLRRLRRDGRVVDLPEAVDELDPLVRLED